MAEPKIDTAWFHGLIKNKGYSQRGFARLIEMDHAALSLMLNGKRKMSVGEAGMLAQFLDQPAAEVLRRAGVEVRAGEREPTPAPDTGRTAEEMRETIARTGFNAWYGRPEYDEHPVQGMWERVADALIAGPLASLIAENENLRSRLLQAEKDLSFKTAVVDTLSRGIGDARRLTNGWAKGTLLLLPFVDMAAGEGLEWVEQEDGSPRMDAADLCAAFAKAMGCELGDAAYTALLAEGRVAIRALNPNQEAGDHEPR